LKPQANSQRTWQVPSSPKAPPEGLPRKMIAAHRILSSPPNCQRVEFLEILFHIEVPSSAHWSLPNESVDSLSAASPPILITRFSPPHYRHGPPPCCGFFSSHPLTDRRVDSCPAPSEPNFLATPSLIFFAIPYRRGVASVYLTGRFDPGPPATKRARYPLVPPPDLSSPPLPPVESLWGHSIAMHRCSQFI